MQNVLKKQLQEKGADIVRFVDISGLPIKQTRGFNKAIIFCLALSKQFILDIFNNVPTKSDEYLEKEQKVEDLADWLAEQIQQNGYQAYGQSEKNNLKNGYLESCYIDPDIKTGPSPVPQKTIAQLAGLGFVGKNNLLITEDYGCAVTICTVLTNAPVLAEKYPMIASKCGECEVCKGICPGKALHGKEWTPGGGRENLVDVAKCCCPLSCMIHCPHTLKYANSK